MLQNFHFEAFALFCCKFVAIYALSGVKLLPQKIWSCEFVDKYHVCYQPTKQQVLSSDGAQVQLRRLSSSVAQHTSVDASVLLGRLLAPAQLNILTDFSLFRNFKQLMGA